LANAAPFFSIITPAYNREKMIATTIDSVLAQTFPDWELLIIDDGSKDNTAQIVKRYNDSRIRYIYQTNAERSAARNNGIAHATGQFICFLDSDDEYLPQHLQTFHDFIKAKNFENAFYYAPSILDSGNKKETSLIYDGTQHHAVWAWHALLQNCGVCVPRTFLKDNNFPLQFNVWEDMHLWLRLLVHNKFYQLPQPLAIVHFHDNRSINNMFETIDIKHIDKYAEAVNHLFTNYYDKLKPILTHRMRIDFIVAKYVAFAGIAAKKGMLKKFLALTKRIISYKPSMIFNPYLNKIHWIAWINSVK
jgi:glycosyltransferase involved in cell wall biosynthesis